MQRQFALRPSRYLAALLIAAHGIALAALLPLAIPALVKTALAFLALCSATHYLRRTAWLAAPTASVALTLEGDQILLTARNGKQLTVRILCDSLVTPWLTILNVLPQGARFAHSVVILPDSMDAESFRRLRVWLKWGACVA